MSEILWEVAFGSWVDAKRIAKAYQAKKYRDAGFFVDIEQLSSDQLRDLRKILKDEADGSAFIFDGKPIYDPWRKLARRDTDVSKSELFLIRLFGPKGRRIDARPPLVEKVKEEIKPQPTSVEIPDPCQADQFFVIEQFYPGSTPDINGPFSYGGAVLRASTKGVIAYVVGVVHVSDNRVTPRDKELRSLRDKMNRLLAIPDAQITDAQLAELGECIAKLRKLSADA